MSYKKTLIFGLIFLIAVGVYLLDKSVKKRKTEARQLAERLITFDKDDIIEIFLKNPHGEFVVEKRDKAWQVVSPIKFPADENTVNVMVSNLTGAKKHNVFKSEDFKAYGLDKPGFEIMLTDKAGQKATLLIGETSTFPGRVFARQKGIEEIFTLSEYVKNNLDKKLFDLRDQTVIKSPPTEVVAVELKNQKGELKGFKDAQDEWKLTRPVEYGADETELENLLRKLNYAKVQAFIDEPTSMTAYGLAEPEIVLSVTKKLVEEENKTTSTILLVGHQIKDKEQYYAMRKGEQVVFQINKDVYEKLNTDPNEFRSKRLFTIDMADVGKLEITTGQSKVILAKTKENKWEFEDDKAIQVDQDSVVNLLSKTISVKAKEFIEDKPMDLAPYELAEPRGSFIITDRKGERTEGFRWGKKPKDKDIVYIQKLNEEAVLGLDWQLLGDFFKLKDDFIDKTLVAINTYEVKKIIATRGKVTLTLAWKDDQWWGQKDEEKQEKKVELAKVDILLDTIADITYQSIVAKDSEEEKEAGLEEPVATYQLFDAEGKQIASLKISISKEKQVYAGIDDGKTYRIDMSDLRSLNNAFSSIEETL